MIELSQPGEVWLLTGSQFLYGEQVLREVREHSQEIAGALSDASEIPLQVLCKNVLKTPEEILQVCADANNDIRCVGVIAWMHTFSPARMWIGGLRILNKPLLHLHTQFNRDIPWKTIDMDFMNLNQSAHGDREFGFIMSRMRLNRKVVAGHWKDPKILSRVGAWIRAARAWSDWQGAKFCRFGDNMREVAVTEGDKVEAQIQFGFAVNGYGIGDVVATIQDVTEAEVSSLAKEYEERYEVVQSLRKGGDRHQSLLDAARIEAGLRAFLKSRNAKGFTDTFEDLHGLRQLPGIAVQRLMNDGYGFGAEGDWKTSALVRAMKVMGEGMAGGNSFMEDYTYHLEPGKEWVLGAHMLEICESVAAKKPRCEIHPLGIGGKADPVRLVFDVSAGPALNASIIDMGNRFRMLINEVEAVGPVYGTPRLPVARVLWKPLPDFYTASEAWILAGGAHHTCYSQNLSSEDLENFAEMAGVECIRIGDSTTIRDFKNELRWNERFYSN